MQQRWLRYFGHIQNAANCRPDRQNIHYDNRTIYLDVRVDEVRELHHAAAAAAVDAVECWQRWL